MGKIDGWRGQKDRKVKYKIAAIVPGTAQKGKGRMGERARSDEGMAVWER
jgi:hypothetical protein